MSFQKKVLQECTKMLLEIENGDNPHKPVDAAQFESILEERYKVYQRRKRSKNEVFYELHDWVASCCITAEHKSDKPFLFDKTKLSFTIMCSNCDTNQEPMINRVQFEKWATKLYPLATKQNYQRVFLALASDASNNDAADLKLTSTASESGLEEESAGSARKGSFGRLRQRLNGGKPSRSMSSLKDANANKQEKSIYGGISMQKFCGYVKELEANFNIEQNECQGIKDSLEQQKECQDFAGHERILYHIRGVSDMTGLPPYYGFVILTDYHLVFQGTALTTRTTCIKLSDVSLGIERTKIGGFLKRDTALKVQCDQGTFTWNVVNIKNTRRDQLYWSIITMQHAHQLAENCGDILTELMKHEQRERGNASPITDELLMKIKRKIIVEAAEDVLRQNAIQNHLENKEKFDAVPFVRYATQKEKEEYIKHIRDELQDMELRHIGSNDGVISSMFKGIMYGGSHSKHMEEKKMDECIDPEEQMKLKKYKILRSEFERENKMKKLDRVAQEKREEFDLRDFYKYIKILRIEFEPLIFLHRMYKCIVGWRNAGLSMTVFLVLEFVAYMNWVHYLPAILLLLNGLLLISCRRDMEYTMQCFDAALVYAGFDPDDFEQETMAAEHYASQKVSEKIKKKQSGEKKNKWNLMQKYRLYKYNYYKSTFVMGFQQKKLADLSVFLGRIRTIYKWDKQDQSQIFCLLSLFLGIFLWIAPLKYVFALCVFGLMFKESPFRSEHAKKKKGIVDRFIYSIPPDIPDVDDSDSDTDSEEDDDDEEEQSEPNTDANHSDDSLPSSAKKRKMKKKKRKEKRQKEKEKDSKKTSDGAGNAGFKSSTDDATDTDKDSNVES